MPVLLAIVVISFVVGLIASPPAARTVAVTLAVVANGIFVWAIADGKGDDPGWLIALSLVGGALAVAAAHLAGKLRRRGGQAVAR